MKKFMDAFVGVKLMNASPAPTMVNVLCRTHQQSYRRFADLVMQIKLARPIIIYSNGGNMKICYKHKAYFRKWCKKWKFLKHQDPDDYLREKYPERYFSFKIISCPKCS